MSNDVLRRLQALRRSGPALKMPINAVRHQALDTAVTTRNMTGPRWIARGAAAVAAAAAAGPIPVGSAQATSTAKRVAMATAAGTASTAKKQRREQRSLPAAVVDPPYPEGDGGAEERPLTLAGDASLPSMQPFVQQVRDHLPEAAIETLRSASVVAVAVAAAAGAAAEPGSPRRRRRRPLPDDVRSAAPPLGAASKLPAAGSVTVAAVPAPSSPAKSFLIGHGPSAAATAAPQAHASSSPQMLPLQWKRGKDVAKPRVLECSPHVQCPVVPESLSPDATAATAIATAAAAATAAATAGAVSAAEVMAAGQQQAQVQMLGPLQRVGGFPRAPAVARKNQSGRQITAARYSQVIAPEPRRAVSTATTGAQPPPTLAAGSIPEREGPTAPRTAAHLMPPPPPPPGSLRRRQAVTTDAQKSPQSSASA
ncbi:hypothetical protein Vretifemale_13302 [Volvox reticuliferus]|nr:hypothetical protein Vretifemale_13302 [Volvox reticuliferus]